MTTSVISYYGNGNQCIRFSPKKSGVATITITARNEASGLEATTNITFKVVTNLELIDVISGTVREYEGNDDVSIYGKYYDTISFKIKDQYKDYFELDYDPKNTSKNLVVTIQGDVITVEDVSINDALPQVFVMVKKNASDLYNVSGVLVAFEMDENTDYHVTDADMRLAGYSSIIYPGDGESLTVSLADWQDKNVQALFNITPSSISRARNVEISAESSDTNVAEILQETEGFGTQRRIYVKVLAVGYSDIILKTKDNLGFEETATIRLVVTE